ncbi:c-type cytochrome [Bradyrhizobium sp. 521_C7_N1_3]|uniref:c-type cytochrome n=1 Tax=Bradyrhizobium sp. 521_C7_N1_3 TaxID=3240368 RepID=UPI003F8A13F5
MKRIVKRVAVRLRQAVGFLLLFVNVVAAESDHYVDLMRGKALVISRDSVARHTSPGGTPFGEWLPLQTPFGQIIAPNITPDDTAGIDSWSSDDFVRAMNEGRRPSGDDLNPAFPYAYYNKVTRVDLDAINAYLPTLAPITNRANRNTLPSPLNMRPLHAGLGKLSIDEIVRYLSTGQTAASVASGPMKDVIENSTSTMPEADLKAIAVHLEERGATAPPASEPLAASDPLMQAGEAIFIDTCSACHTRNGGGIEPIFPNLVGNGVVTQDDPTSVIHVVIAGGRAAASDKQPTPPAMPSLGFRLTDGEIAAVVTYIRNSWGNSAPAVAADTVKAVRCRESGASIERAGRLPSCWK